MDPLDRAIVNRLQAGFPVVERPFAAAARELGTSEDELIARLEELLERGVLTRFGPMYQIERMGGAFSLAAMRVPRADFERVAGIVNAMPEIAHNYEREHDFNMWFVLATETREGIGAAIGRIEAATGYIVFNFPKLKEYFVELKLAV
ncbi:MAG: Lrp/AsnC family transcriptional regulator [Betaproteobacteria bacterium]|nr:Lrp/AsnC family transcriptional regulator [Betaproteobacteria bacterium]